jgi:hypothetical protein
MSETPVAVSPVKVETFDANPAPSASEVLFSTNQQAAVDAVEVTPEAKPEAEVKPEVDVSAIRFAELSRRTKEQFRKEQELKQLEERLNPINDALSKAKENPLAILEAAGLSYEDLTDFILQGAFSNEAPRALSVEEKVEQLELRLKAEEDAKVQKQQEAEQAHIESSIASFKNTVRELAESPDFELIKATEQHDMVYDLVLAHHESTGEVLPIDRAMQLVEEHLLNELESKAFKTNKIRQRLMPESQPSQQATSQVHKPIAPKVTLSNSMTTQTQAQQPSAKLSPEDARAKAIAMLSFK